MIIKVCGMRDPANIREACGCGVTLLGLNFCEGSPRRVDPASRAAILGAAALPLAGVFMDMPPEAVAREAAAWGLRFVQLHGRETPREARAVREALRKSGSEARVIKAIRVKDGADLALAPLYAEAADLVLLDAKTALPGGSGVQFDWELLSAYAGPLPFLLAGGIGPGDAPRIRAISHPLLAGIDINSRFETAPGAKDCALISAFVRELFLPGRKDIAKETHA